MTITVCCNKLDEGRIIAKHYEPENTYLYMYPVYTSDGKDMHLSHFIPIYMVDDEDWMIDIIGSYKGEVKRETYYVSQEQYDSLKIGQVFCTKNCIEPKKDKEQK